MCNACSRKKRKGKQLDFFFIKYKECKHNSIHEDEMLQYGHTYEQQQGGDSEDKQDDKQN